MFQSSVFLLMYQEYDQEGVRRRGDGISRINDCCMRVHQYLSYVTSRRSCSLKDSHAGVMTLKILLMDQTRRKDGIVGLAKPSVVFAIVKNMSEEANDTVVRRLALSWSSSADAEGALHSIHHADSFAVPVRTRRQLSKSELNGALWVFSKER
jgi:hypothetical protein